VHGPPTYEQRHGLSNGSVRGECRTQSLRAIGPTDGGVDLTVFSNHDIGVLRPTYSYLLRIYTKLVLNLSFNFSAKSRPNVFLVGGILLALLVVLLAIMM